LTEASSRVLAAHRARADSDEAYVLDLCDAILGEPASRQHRFDWLVGDPGRNGRSRALPVDAYYAARQLVVEYRERQHDGPVAHFDKSDVLTVSGVHRGIQRRIYDERRAVEIPAHGLRDYEASRHAGRHRTPQAHSLRDTGVVITPTPTG
jgi:hypothetical protein